LSDAKEEYSKKAEEFEDQKRKFEKKAND